MRINRAQLLALAKENGYVGKQRKYRNLPCEIDGIKFASQAEGRRYVDLKLMEAAKLITDLVLQKRYPIVISDLCVCTYIADFRYTCVATGETVVEDVKGVATPVYIIKKKLMLAVHGISIKEVR